MPEEEPKKLEHHYNSIRQVTLYTCTCGQEFTEYDDLQKHIREVEND